MREASSQVVPLLRRWGDGDSEAFDQLIPLVYDRLRRLAHQRLRNDGRGSLNTTGLVHEAYLAMADSPIVVADRGHFLGIASRVMRHLIVDHARARNAAKRGGGVTDAAFDEATWVAEGDVDTVTELDDALERLALMHPRQSRILEQRYFGGLSLEETAEALGISLATVKRELRSARAWLATQLKTDLP
jgi:RNA polymerase sigma factor (TIGR02999 family)